MRNLMKAAAKSLFLRAPRPVRERVYYSYAGYPSAKSIRALPSKRDLAHLEALVELCPKRTSLEYDSSSLARRAEGNWKRIEETLGEHVARPRRLLEVGCGEGGFVRCALEQGHDAVGIDLAFPRFDFLSAENEQLRERLKKGSGSDMPFADGSMEVIVSLAALEHYMDVEGFFREVQRVLAPGGVLYASSGGLWNSPWGAHIYNTIPVPWAHLIYDYDVIEAYFEKHAPDTVIYSPEQIPEDRRDMPYGGMNQFKASHYRDVIEATQLEALRYEWVRTSLGSFLDAFPDVVEAHGRDELLDESFEAVLKQPES